jgi:cysteine synthase/RimJ/RimL family protein N-acetyltransferase
MELNTTRIKIRPWQTGDASHLQAMSQDLGYAAFAASGRFAYDSSELAKREIVARMELFAKDGTGKFPIFLQKDRTFIGTCGVQYYNINGRDELELGFRLLTHFRGHGYAREAAVAILNYAFETLRASSVMIFSHPLNTASLRVLEYLPATFTGEIQHSGTAHHLFRVERSSFLAWQSSPLPMPISKGGDERSLATCAKSVGQTPLVLLKHISRDLPVPIYAKCEHMNPGGSIKDRIAFAIIRGAEHRGTLKKGMTIIEATAGNTGMGLALACAAKGYKLVCVMPEKMCEDKIAALKTLGVEIVRTPNVPPTDPQNFRNVVERLAQENGWFMSDQFANPDNLRVHYQTTGPEIFRQMGYKLGAFVAGSGTGGTITGVGRYLKERLPSSSIILADPAGSGLAHWVKTGTMGPDAPYLIEGIGGSIIPTNLHRDAIDDAISVSDQVSFSTVHELIRDEGLLVGGSSGTNVAAAVKLAKTGNFRDPIVTVLPDSWDRYWSRSWMSSYSQTAKP